MGFYPTPPANVTFSYTVLGKPNNFTIEGPAQFCNTTVSYTIPNIPVGRTVTWSATGNITFPTVVTGKTITVNGASSNSTLSAIITSSCGSQIITRTFNQTVGIPIIPIISNGSIINSSNLNNLSANICAPRNGPNSQ